MSPPTLEHSQNPENREDRNYAIMLILLALINDCSAIMTFFIGQMPATPPNDPIETKWLFHLLAAISGFVALLTVATLIARARGRSDACVIWTRAYNFFLLLVLPFGTAAGIYGLWKLDKVRRTRS